MENRKLINPTSTPLISATAMQKCSPLLFDLLTLSIDTCKIYFKNGRLIMALIATLSISLQTMFFLFKSYYVEPSMAHSMISLSFSSSPRRPDYTDLSFGRHEDIKARLQVESAFFVINTVLSFFLAITTINASAFIHGKGKAIPIKELVSNTARSVKRPFITCFYVALLSLGSIFLCLLTLLPIALTVGNGSGVIASILLTISAIVFCTYLSVVWSLSLVVSTLEEKAGMEALAKAARIANGKIKVQGFVLNLGITVISLISLQCLGVIQMMQLSKATKMAAWLVAVNSVWMVKMAGQTAYTVLYFECKKADGEEIELLQSDELDLEYTKVPTLPPTSDNIP